MLSHTLQLIHSNDWPRLLAFATAYFLAIYIIFALLATLLAKKISRPIRLKPLYRRQLLTEVLRSLRSIALFGVGLLLPWGMIQYGFAEVTIATNHWKVIAECLVLVIWNDLHFYAMHRLMHAKLKKAHGIHHQSITCTPFAAYAMGLTEAALLGSVMPIVMPFHTFSLQALLFLPIWSIFINTLAHSNTYLFGIHPKFKALGFIAHHQAHHSNYQGNYSFFFYQLDDWFGTVQTARKPK